MKRITVRLNRPLAADRLPLAREFLGDEKRVIGGKILAPHSNFKMTLNLRREVPLREVLAALFEFEPDLWLEVENTDGDWVVGPCVNGARLSAAQKDFLNQSLQSTQLSPELIKRFPDYSWKPLRHVGGLYSPDAIDQLLNGHKATLEEAQTVYKLFAAVGLTWPGHLTGWEPPK